MWDLWDARPDKRYGDDRAHSPADCFLIAPATADGLLVRWRMATVTT